MQVLMKKKTTLNGMQIMCFLFLIFFVMLVDVPVAVLAQPSGEVYIYSFSESYSSEMLLDYFGNKSDLVVTFYDLNDANCSVEFLKIVYILARLGVEVVPAYMCTPCELTHFSWEEIYQMYASPMIVLFSEGRLSAITIATFNGKVLDQVINNPENSVKLFHWGGNQFILAGEDARIQLEEVITRQEGTDVPPDIFQILPLIIMAAAVDAINPCEFYVLIVFLSLVFFRIGRKAILKAGIAFSIAIFIVYYLMGLGLFQLIAYVQEARLFIVVLGFSLGLRAVLTFVFGVFGLSLGLRDTIGAFLNKKFRRVPEFFSKRLSAHLRRASENPLMAFVIGVVASSFLLPCTSGPYLIALSLIADLETLVDGLFLLTVYNGIIIIPFIAITLGIYTLKMKTGELKKWSSQKQKWLNLVAGLLMMLLSLYLISTINL